MLPNSLWGVLQPSEMLRTVSSCMPPVLSLLCDGFLIMHSDSLWGVLQPSEVLWTVSHCHLLTLTLTLLLLPSHSCPLVLALLLLSSHSWLLALDFSLSSPLYPWQLLIFFGSKPYWWVQSMSTSEHSVICSGVSHNLVRCSRQSWLHAPCTNVYYYLLVRLDYLDM